jgi:hypothetical protein
MARARGKGPGQTRIFAETTAMRLLFVAIWFHRDYAGDLAAQPLNERSPGAGVLDKEGRHRIAQENFAKLLG